VTPADAVSGAGRRPLRETKGRCPTVSLLHAAYSTAGPHAHPSLPGLADGQGSSGGCFPPRKGEHHGKDWTPDQPHRQQGAAFLCADLALTPEPRPDHAAYVASWLKVLRGDKRAIFTAAAKAQAAADWMHARQGAAAQPRADEQARAA